MSTGGLALNLATVRRQFGLKEALEACRQAGIDAVAPWRDQIAAVGLDVAARLIRDSGLAVSGLCRGGMFTAADAEGRQRAIEDNKRAVDEAAAIGARCLVLVVGGLPPGSRDLRGARQMVADGLAAVLPHARAAGVPLAIEPLHPMYAADRAVISTLAQALDLCEELGAGLGVAIDTYHTWWDPLLADGIARAGRTGAILAHHIADWRLPTRDMLNDRAMIGDGVIDFSGFRRMIEAAGYHGPQEIELFSDEWWGRPGDEVVATCRERYAAHC